MSAPIRDDENSDYGRYAPKRAREQLPMPAAKNLYVATTSPSAPEDQDRQTMSEMVPWAEQVREPLRRRPSSLRMIGRIAGMVTFAALIAFLTILAKPLWQEERTPLSANSQPSPASKTSDRLSANNAPANSTLVPATWMAAVSGGTPSASAQTQQAPLAGSPGGTPSVNAQAQQASLSPNSQEPRNIFRGVTGSEIRFGISAPFSGAAKELGQNMRLGIEAAFKVANASGGVHGRQLTLIAADDGYEPTRTAVTMKQLYEKDQVFGLVGNVGTPTAAVGLPYALDRKMLFFGAFTGAGLLRSDPPDRYVFNYRASYAEETSAVVNYLVKVKRLKPSR